jgi:N utilization substance protein B
MNRAPARVLDEWRAAGRSIPDYTEDLVRDVAQHISDIDVVLSAHSDEWPVHRMAVVDRTILRVACAEMASGLPAAVAINEAVTIASELASDDSGRFINGILGRVAREMGASDPGVSPRGGDRPQPT